MKKLDTNIVRNSQENLELLDLIKQLQSLSQNAAGISTHGQTVAGIKIQQNVGKIIEIATKDTMHNTMLSWMTHIFTQQNLQNIDENKMNQLMSWLVKSVSNETLLERAMITSALAAITNIGKLKPKIVHKYWTQLFHPSYSELLKLLNENQAENNGVTELKAAMVECMEILLGGICETNTEVTELHLETCEAVANSLLQVHFNSLCKCTPQQISQFSLSSLITFNKIIHLCPAYAQSHVGELFGLAKSYLQFNNSIDAENMLPIAPQKIKPSQQPFYDTESDADLNEQKTNARNRGGKMSKTRKPRAVAKGNRHLEFVQNQGRYESSIMTVCVDMPTSDSEASDAETAGNHIIQERYRRAKIRLAAITLIGAVARAQERRILYGYWHAIFPNGLKNSQDNLLYVAQNDQNARCRSAALQIAAQTILGSKMFLNLAESPPKHNSATFLSFAVSLGLTVEAIYDALTFILEHECSLPVLTQALKCLAVLVQATPFPKLSEGLVIRFVQRVRPLIYHRDCTIQVSALMVLEFLIATSELTTEISDAVGMPRASKQLTNSNRQNDEAFDMINAECFEESIDSDGEGADFETGKSSEITCTQADVNVSEFSWLMQRILHNLNYEIEANIKLSPAVRIESLQILSAMTTHFNILQNSPLESVAQCLHNALHDALPDVRLYAARCLDSCAYQISRHLIEHQANTADDYKVCKQFWLRMLPTIMALIRAEQPEQVPAFKVCLCDCLSNVGVVMFEQLPHGTQMNLLSFLSGISSESDEDVTVRAAAVRAMAVLVLFPSLRGNLVFVENTAELILRLVADTNIQVRVKSFWSMGNVSDALINADTTHERISVDLLKRLIIAATQACSDCDKVRCNSVRALGNLLRLLSEHTFEQSDMRVMFQKAMQKLIDCIRCGGNAKVKWNSCYAIGNVVQNSALFMATAKYADLNWQQSLYPALCHVVVHHANFKVRINAAAAIANIKERSYFGVHFEMFWLSLLAAIEQSNNLDNFYEYNHRDNLQEQLCLTICHFMHCASIEDFPLLRKHLITEKVEVVRNTWLRVANRMVPEKAAPLLACGAVLRERFKNRTQLTNEQSSAINFITNMLSLQ